MDRKDFFKAVANDYFESRTVQFDGFTEMIKGVMPVFGELKTEITEQDGSRKKTIVFVDIDEADAVFAPAGYTPSKEDLDMSTVLLKLTINTDGVIEIVEHGLGIFTPANKDLILFFGSLIGKIILF